MNATDRSVVATLVLRDMATPTLVKADVKAAINAIDQWITDNDASFNAAIPLPTRTSLTINQKTQLFVYIINQRFNIGA